MDFSDLFPSGDYRFHMGLRRRELPAYFESSPSPIHEQLLVERNKWLDHDPSTYAAVLDDGVPMIEETVRLARSWGTELPDTEDSCLELGRRWEPDFLLLDNQLRLQAGCVCFPTGWSLEEKVGKPIDWIHAVVPGLNEEIGSKVERFLQTLSPGHSWERANWGLSRSPELNLHPKRELPRLDATVTCDEVWLRVERQALVALPETGGILFGIRLEIGSLAELCENRDARIGLRNALETMPEPIAAYKNIASARNQLLRFLESPSI